MTDETLRVLAECGGNRREAARRLGIARSSLQDRLRAQCRQGADVPPPAAGPLVIDKQSILRNPDGSERARWDKLRQPRMADEDADHIPDPRLVTKIATHYDGQGDVIGQWVSETPDARERETRWREFAAGLIETLPRLDPIAAPPPARDDLMIGIPVGDHHFGMLTWEPETGDNYDIAIATKLLENASEHLIALAPPCETALIALLGDFLHYDSFVAETPTNRNKLDADSRYPKMVRAALRGARRLIETAARRYARVQVIIEIGNHDLSTSIFLAEALAHIYERDERIAIDTSPQHVHYFRFGRNLIGTHHGHGIKLDQLPLTMATDRPEDWGATTHRAWWTGHIHSRRFLDAAGCTVESFRILAPPDAWAHQQGYRPHRTMQAIVYHAEHGEVARHSVNPSMYARGTE